MIHFPKCPFCPVAPHVTCHAQRAGATSPYCGRLAAGGPAADQARACVLSRSKPDPTPKPPEPAPIPREAKPRMALGTPQKPPADCIPCQQKAAMRAIALEPPAG